VLWGAAGASLMVVGASLIPLLSGCSGMGGPIAARVRPDTRRPEPGAVLFICDGLSNVLVREGCAAGWLPNIQRRFVEGGTCVEHACTSVPSVTYGILTTFVTGVPPATHGIVGNRWYDRDWALLRDYAFIKHYRAVNQDFFVPTIYELLRPESTASIQNAIMRGATRNFANWAVSGTMWFFRDYTAVDKLTSTTIDRVAVWADREDAWPALLTCYYPGLDSVGHTQGPESERYRWAVQHADYQVGRVCDWLERQGLLETTYLALVADHGMLEIRPDGYVDLRDYVGRRWGRRVLAAPVQDAPYAQRRAALARYDTVLIDGLRFGTLHFAGPEGWEDAPTPEQVGEILAIMPAEQAIWDLPGVDVAAWLSGANEVTLESGRGSARIDEREGSAEREYRYVPVPDDVLGYTTEPKLAEFVGTGFHTSRDWLAETAASQYPDVVPNLGPLLRQRRGGQLLLFAARGYSFGREQGSHGGLLHEEMNIPMMFAGPGVSAGATIECARAVDLAPTLLELLGRTGASDSMEGQPLFPAGNAATTAVEPGILVVPIGVGVHDEWSAAYRRGTSSGP